MFSKLLKCDTNEVGGEGFHSQINLGNAGLTLLVFIKRCFKTLNSVSVLYEAFPKFLVFFEDPYA